MSIERRQRTARASRLWLRPDKVNHARMTREHQRSGFVLAELVIAICVVTASFAGVFALANQSMRIVNDMKNESRAVQAAESEMERLRAMSWGNLVGLNPAFALDPAGTPGLSELSGARGVVRISMVPGTANGDRLRAVSVRITWSSRDGRTKEVALATLITPHGADHR